MRIKSLVFHLIILGTIAGTFTLGLWQLQRREWKRELVQTMQSRAQMLPADLPQQIDADWYWRTVRASGTLDYDHKILIPYYGELEACGEPAPAWGNEIWVPLRRADGKIIFYRKGVAAKDDPFIPYATGQREVKDFQAVLRPFPAVSIFSPANQPEKGRWLRGNVDLYHAIHAPPLGYFLENDGALSGDEMDGCVSPKPLWNGAPQLPNNHLQYAITWFTLAGVLLALYLYKIRHGA